MRNGLEFRSCSIAQQPVFKKVSILGFLIAILPAIICTPQLMFKQWQETFCPLVKDPSSVPLQDHIRFDPETEQARTSEGTYSGHLTSGYKWNVGTYNDVVSLSISDPVFAFSNDAERIPFELKGLSLLAPGYKVERQESDDAFGLTVVHEEKQILKARDLVVVSTQSDGNDKTAAARELHSGAIGLTFDFPFARSFYGIPQHADSFRLKPSEDRLYRLFNLDVYKYELESPAALYGSIPFIVGFSADSSKPTVGVIWNNPSETWVEVGETFVRFKSSTLDTEIFFLLGPSLQQVYQQLIKISGKPAFPPLWSLGYHQCRWNYNDDADVWYVDSEMDKQAMPYDTIWLDIEHTEDKKYFTWDHTKFSDPMELQMHIASKGRNMVTIHDPHIKNQAGYFLRDHGLERDIFVKESNGRTVFEGKCWPGKSYYLDWLNPECREYWASLFAVGPEWHENRHVWIDMNEPKVFNHPPEDTLPLDALHYGGFRHKQVHNLYGTLMHEATYKGMERRLSPSKRPFVLSRSFYLGSQRWGAVWIGDNMASWEHLQATSAELLSISLAGISFVGADVGGYFGNPDEELLVRWYQMGALQPFFREHSEISTKRREPYIFAKSTRDRIRKALRLRYKLMPYIFTLFSQAAEAPVMRPLLWHYPEYEMEDQQFMLGDSVLAAPILHPVSDGYRDIEVKLPTASVWYDFWSGEHVPASRGEFSVENDLDILPLFVRGGSILPLKERPRRSTAAQKNDPLTLVIAVDLQEAASGRIYEDDADLLESPYATTTAYTYLNGVLTSRVSISGPTPSKTRIERIRLWRVGEREKVIKVVGNFTGENWTLSINA